MEDNFFDDPVLVSETPQDIQARDSNAIFSILQFIYVNKITLAAIVVFFAVSISNFTRYLTDRGSVSSNGAKSVPMRPYWIPFVGHAVDL